MSQDKSKQKLRPSKMVRRLGAKVMEALGDKPYATLEEEAAGDGRSPLPHITLGWFANERELQRLGIDELVSKWVEDSANKRSSNGVGWDRVTVDLDFDRGKIYLIGVLDGATISDPEQDIEVPAMEDMDQQEIEDALKDLGASDYGVRWKFGESEWSDISQISYDVYARWDFDPEALAQEVLDQDRAASAIARGIEKYEAYTENPGERPQPLVYVEQYGELWKLTPKQWRALVEGGAAGGGYILEGEPLTRMPKTLYRDEDGHFETFQPHVQVVRPLDWRPEDFQEELERLHGSLNPRPSVGKLKAKLLR